MRQEAHSGSSCSPWWRHSLVWEGTRPTHFPWNINAIMIIIVSEHFGNGTCGVTSHHVSSSAPSEGYERCPLFRPCPRSKARWGLRWALVAARSNPREYQLLSQQNVAKGQRLQATIGISWMQLLHIVVCEKIIEDTVCYFFLIVYAFLIFLYNHWLNCFTACVSLHTYSRILVRHVAPREWNWSERGVQSRAMFCTAILMALLLRSRWWFPGSFAVSWSTGLGDMENTI